MKIVSLVLMLVVLSCGKKTNDETKPRGEIRAALLPQTAPNQYFTSVDWTVPPGPSERFLARQRQGERVILCDLERCPKPYLDVAISAGESLSYTILEAEEVIAESTFVAPKDFVLEGTQRLDSLPSLSEFRRLFLKNGTRLVTNGAAVIAVEEIISEDAVIETFAETDVVASGQGRSAGKLIVKARTASGKLTVISRGEKGAKGAGGIPGVQGLTGKTGAAAVLQDCRAFTGGDYQKTVICENNLGMTGGVPITHPWWRNIYTCMTPNLDGAEGADGGHGFPGDSGHAGGDAGSVRVEIENPSNLTFDLTQVGGLGGDGGDGGTGGPGGIGGQPGARDVHEICSAGKQGPQGRQGPNGPSGKPGARGNASATKCVILGSKREGTCD